MSFLAPLFLVGGLAIAAPILFHLIRRSVRDRVEFSSLMFLAPSPPRTTRKRKLEHLILLALRCLILLALAAAFARPFFAKDITPPDATGAHRQIVILIDTSASMRRAGLWTKAHTVAERWLDKATPADEVAIMTFDRQSRTVQSMTEWNSWPADQRAALTRQRLDAISPGWMGTQLGPALLDAAAQFANQKVDPQTPAQRSIVLISDMQEGVKLDGLQGHDWPNGLHVAVERIDSPKQSNAGLEIPEGSAGTVRVTNSKDSTKEKFHLAWQGVSDSTEIYLPSGQTHTFPTPKLPSGVKTAALQLTGDDADFDNISYFAAPEVEDVSICYFGSELTNDPAKPLYYLQRVFPDSARRHVKIVGLDALNQSAFAIVPGSLTAEQTTALRDWLASGKTALLLLAGQDSAPVLSGLLSQSVIQITDAASDYALLGQIDFKHPIFAPFDDPRYSDFTPIHFWKHRRWEIPPALTNATVLAKFDDGSPALAQIPIGKGNLLVLASGWSPSDSQLAVSSKFPPLMETMLDWSGSGAPARFQFRTGDSLPPPRTSTTEIEWAKPDGTKKSLSAAAPFTETDLPGIYTATVSDPAAHGGKIHNFAVNLSLDESKITPLSQDELARLGVPIGPASEEPTATTRIHQRQLLHAELENSQKLWRWFLLSALAIACVEIILSGILSPTVKTAGAGR